MSDKITPVLLIATSHDCPACQVFKTTSYHAVIAKLESHFGFPIVILETPRRTTDSIVETLKKSSWPDQRTDVLTSISRIIPHWPCIILISPRGLPEFQIYGLQVIRNGSEMRLTRDEQNPAYLIPNNAITIEEVLTRVVDWINRYIGLEEYKTMLINSTTTEQVTSPSGTQNLLTELLTSNVVHSGNIRTKSRFRLGIPEQT